MYKIQRKMYIEIFSSVIKYRQSEVADNIPMGVVCRCNVWRGYWSLQKLH